MDFNATLLGIDAASEKCKAVLIESCMATCNGIEQRLAWAAMSIVIAMIMKNVIKKHFNYENGELLGKKAGWTWCNGNVMVQLEKNAELYLDLIIWTTSIAMCYMGFISIFF